MGWKKIAESQELIVFENRQKEYALKIEARKSDGGWEVFMSKLTNNTSMLISDYYLDSKKQAVKLIERLKKKKALKAKRRAVSTPDISMKREYKEEYAEKWRFRIDKDKIDNTIILKFDNNMSVDVILHERYRYQEYDIINRLEKKLGLSDIADTVHYDIYYFRKKTTRETVNAASYKFFDVEFDFDD